MEKLVCNKRESITAIETGIQTVQKTFLYDCEHRRAHRRARHEGHDGADNKSSSVYTNNHQSIKTK